MDVYLGENESSGGGTGVVNVGSIYEGCSGEVSSTSARLGRLVRNGSLLHGFWSSASDFDIVGCQEARGMQIY